MNRKILSIILMAVMFVGVGFVVPDIGNTDSKNLITGSPPTNSKINNKTSNIESNSSSSNYDGHIEFPNLKTTSIAKLIETNSDSTIEEETEDKYFEYISSSIEKERNGNYRRYYIINEPQENGNVKGRLYQEIYKNGVRVASNNDITHSATPTTQSYEKLVTSTTSYGHSGHPIGNYTYQYTLGYDAENQQFYFPKNLSSANAMSNTLKSLEAVGNPYKNAIDTGIKNMNSTQGPKRNMSSKFTDKEMANLIKSIQNKAKKLTVGITDDYEKTRTIALWIAENFPYPDDMSSYSGYPHEDYANPYIMWDKYLKGENADTVCYGYSQLAEVMLQAVDVPALTIRNNLKYGINSPVSHVTNVVYVDNQWAFLDITNMTDTQLGRRDFTFMVTPEYALIYYQMTFFPNLVDGGVCYEGQANLVGGNTQLTKLTLDPKGGKVAQPYKYVVAENKYSTLETPIKTGHQFIGWFLEEEYINRISAHTIVNNQDDHTIYAKWTPYNYSVTINDGSSSKETATFESEITITADAIDGKTFKEWNVVFGDVTLNDKDSETTTFTMPAENVKITAIYEDTESYDINISGGAANVNKSYAGNTITITADEPPSGMEFLKWNVESGDVELSDIDSSVTTFTMPDENVFISATYQQTSFDVSIIGGTSNVTRAIPGEVVIVTANALNTRVFSNWSVIEGESSLIENTTSESISFIMPESDVEIRGHYTDKLYPVNIVSGYAFVYGGEYGITEYASKKEVQIEANNAPIGQKFSKWEVVSGDVDIHSYYLGINPSRVVVPIGGMTMQAIYSKIDYSVLVTGGSASKTTANYEDEITLNAIVAPEKKFIEWQVNSGNITLSSTSSAIATFVMPAESVSVTAITQDKDLYGITVNSGIANKSSTYEGDTVTISALDASAGKEFDHWQIDTGEITLKNANSPNTTFTMPEGAVELTAVYKDKEKYSITVNNGSTSKNSTYEGDIVTISAFEPANGKVFDCWQINTGDISLKNANSSNTSFVMSKGAVELTATYRNIAAPIIKSQVANDMTYERNSIAKDLSVNASGSSLSYQWYCYTGDTKNINEIISGNYGKALPNATGPTFTPPTDTAGTFHYYVIVKNPSGEITGNIAKIIIKKSIQTIDTTTSFTKTHGDSKFYINPKSSGGGTFSFLSSNLEVAIVDNASGLITIKGPGQTNIKITAAANTNYEAASQNVTLTVKPKKVTGLKLKKGNKRFKVTYKKAHNVSGYKITYSTKKNFKSAKSKHTTKRTFTVKKLKKNKRYYVKVQAYKIINGKKVYGKYSAVKKIKTK